jgi:hypothetical protein
VEREVKLTSEACAQDAFLWIVPGVDLGDGEAQGLVYSSYVVLV